MTFVPVLADVDTYLGDENSWDDWTLQSALDAELAAQSRVCKIPHAFDNTDPANPVDLGPDYPADLAAALYRRVARHLQMKERPLGYEYSIEGGAASYISANDSEIKRLEAPYRKRVVG